MALPAPRFGVVHGGVGVQQQRLGTQIDLPDSYPDAGGNEQVVPIHIKRRRHSVADSIGQLKGRILMDRAADQNHKLIAAHARHQRLRLPERRLHHTCQQAIGDTQQHRSPAR